MIVREKIESCIKGCETIEQVTVCEEWVEKAVFDYGDRLHLFNLCDEQEDKVYRYAPIAETKEG